MAIPYATVSQVEKIVKTVPKGDKGDPGTSAGFGTPTATIDSGVGTPSVSISSSGPNTAKVFNFEFHNLKGAPGTGGTQLYRHNITITSSGVSKIIQVINKSSTAYSQMSSIEYDWTSFAIITAGYFNQTGTISRYTINAITLSGSNYSIGYTKESSFDSFSVPTSSTVTDEVFAL